MDGEYYLLLVGVRDGNALGRAVHIAGFAGLDATEALGLVGSLGSRGGIHSGSRVDGCLSARDEGEDAGKEDRGNTHVDGVVVSIISISYEA